jgi:hypothetical protein
MNPAEREKDPGHRDSAGGPHEDGLEPETVADQDRIRCDAGDRGEQAAAELDLSELREVVIVFDDSAEDDDGPWPTETWGPLHPEHFALRTLDDLDRLPTGPA